MNNPVYIKIDGMCCPGCVGFVELLLKELNIPFHLVNRGGAELESELATVQRKALGKRLKEYKLKLQPAKQPNSIEQIKAALDFYEDSPRGAINYTRAYYLAEKFEDSYENIADFFYDTEHTNIRDYCIQRKMDKACDYLDNTEYSVTDIAELLNYCSEQYFINQFKIKVGVTPLNYRNRDK